MKTLDELIAFHQECADRYNLHGERPLGHGTHTEAVALLRALKADEILSTMPVGEFPPAVAAGPMVGIEVIFDLAKSDTEIIEDWRTMILPALPDRGENIRVDGAAYQVGPRLHIVAGGVASIRLLLLPLNQPAGPRILLNALDGRN